MAWPLIAVGAALMAGSAIGASSEEGGDILNLKYPNTSTEEELASKTLLDVATKLYDQSEGSNPEFYKRIFETLPETKMSETDRTRLKETYSQVSLLANQKAMEQAGQAFGENIDSLVERGVMSPAQADKQKVQNEAQVRAMMSILDKRWKATEIADARKMWIGDQQSQARSGGMLAETRAKSQAMFNQAVDTGLKFALRRAGAIQDFQGAQMTANEKVLTEARAAEYDFWGKMLMPGQGGKGGSGASGYSYGSKGSGLYSQYPSNPGLVDSFYSSGSGSGMWNTSGAGWGSYGGSGLGGGYA